MSDDILVILLILSGIGHICLSLGSLAVPKLLDWKKHLDTAPSLLRQVFWTYSAYIKGVNISFGIIAIVGARDLVAPTFLAGYINLFITLYWLGRLCVDFFYFDTASLKGIAKLSDQVLVVLVFLFVLVHGAAFARNLQLF